MSPNNARNMKRTNLIKARQIKAARALLGWLQEDLAHAANLSVATIRKLELGYISPRSATMANIREAFEQNGLEFLEPDGVRHRQENIATYIGPDGAIDFFEDIQRTIKNRDEEIIIVCKSGSLFDFNTNCTDECVEIMAAIKGKDKANIKCLLTEDLASPLTTTFCECRALSKNYVDPTPYYVYGNKYAIFEKGPMPKIIVIQSLSISQSLRQQFNSMWEKATPLRVPETLTISAARLHSR